MEGELLIYSRAVRWVSLRGWTFPTPAPAGPVTTNMCGHVLLQLGAACFYNLDLNSHMSSLSWLAQIYSLRVTGVWTLGRRSRRQPRSRCPNSSCCFHLCPELQGCPVLPSGNDSGLWTLHCAEKEGERNCIPGTCCLCIHPDSAVLFVNGHIVCMTTLEKEVHRSKLNRRATPTFL